MNRWQTSVVPPLNYTPKDGKRLRNNLVTPGREWIIIWGGTHWNSGWSFQEEWRSLRTCTLPRPSEHESTYKNNSCRCAEVCLCRYSTTKVLKRLQRPVKNTKVPDILILGGQHCRVSWHIRSFGSKRKLPVSPS